MSDYFDEHRSPADRNADAMLSLLRGVRSEVSMLRTEVRQLRDAMESKVEAEGRSTREAIRNKKIFWPTLFAVIIVLALASSGRPH